MMMAGDLTITVAGAVGIICFMVPMFLKAPNNCQFPVNGFSATEYSSGEISKWIQNFHWPHGH